MLWEENRVTADGVLVTRIKLKCQTQHWATNFRTGVWWHALCSACVWGTSSFFVPWFERIIAPFFVELVLRFIYFLPSQTAHCFCLPQHKHMFRPLVQFKFIKFRFLFQAYLNLIGVLRHCSNSGLCYCCSAVTPSRQHCQTAFKVLRASHVRGENQVTAMKKTYTDILIIINRIKVTILQQL